MNQRLPPADLDQVDQWLAGWKDRLSRVDENLMALEQQPTMQLLDGAALTGETQRRVAPALAAMRELFQQRGLLSDTVAQADRLRQAGGRRKPSPETLAAIQRLLQGASITLPPLHTPIGERDLLTSSERHISPENLLTAMTQAYETARDAVMEVDRAWSRLSPALQQAGDQIVALEGQARSLGDDATTELTAVRTQLDALRGQVAGDPLGAAGGLDGRLSALLGDLRARLDSLAQEQQQVQGAQARARALLAELRSTHAAAEQALPRFQREIAHAGSTPQLPDGSVTEGLATWLVSIDGAVASGRRQAAKVGLSRWLQAAEAQLRTERIAADALAGPVALREELLGRVSAQRAQLRALQLRGQASDPALDARARDLADTLERLPVQIDAVTPLVAAFDAALRPILERARASGAPAAPVDRGPTTPLRPGRP